MKKSFLIISLIAVCLFSFVSCQSAKTVTNGLENIAYLQLNGDTGKYTDPVTVTLDGNATFSAAVNSSSSRNVKHFQTYKIATGAHDIVITFKNETIINKKIFASANEVTIVELP